MSRVLKIVLGVFAVLVVLVLAAAALIMFVVDPADYRDRITQAISAETGRSARIEGDISLSFFPTIGFEVGRMSLGNPPGFGDEPFVEIESAAIGARVMPLLSRRLEVSKLRLEGLQLHLVERADGSANWRDAAGEEDTGAGGAPPAGGQAGTGFQFTRIDGLEVRDVNVRYEHLGDGRVVEIGVPRLTTGPLSPGQPFDLEAEVTLALDAGATRVQGRLETVLLLHAGGSGLEMSEFVLQVDATGATLPGGQQAARVEVPRLVVDLAAQTLDLPQLVLDAAGLRATAGLQGRGLMETPEFDGQLEVAEFSPRELLRNLGEAPPQTRDPAVLGRLALSAEMRFAAGTLALEDVRLVLDDSNLEGRLALTPGEVNRVRGELALDTIDLDRYLGPEADETAAAAPTEDTPLAFDWLQALDLDLGLRAGSVVVSGLRLAAVETRAVVKEGRLALEPLSADLYEGEARGSAVIDARRAPATLRLRQSLEGLQLQPFTTDLADFERLTGVARLEADLATSAATTAGLLSGLDGNVGFQLSDGYFRGVNLWFEIQRAYALAKGRPVPEKTSPDTEFRELSGTAVIRDGQLVNEDLVGGLPFIALAGRGAVDLAAGTLDYRLTATVIREAVDETTGERSELAGARIPLRLSGELASPKVSVDVAELLKDEAVEKLKERALDPLRKLRDRLRPDG
ncbi:AsmA family protein [Thioalkalivibrio sp. XN279]|uniref:AsmA family protein n=1 Tax=Thioalkalivibrio sp. XN279 TaxID=2714953 RepID=UPI00140C3087|nr:AsmA family protein [Thioalkalivibrio sp. XN279]NHA13531.1 AsmA family protein [Thioalkalivibrio sp. XN279]